MKTMVTWSAQPGKFAEAATNFLAGKGEPPAGLKMLGRWHSVDLGSGFVLFETDDATLLYRNAAIWADILDVGVTVVIEDHEAAPILIEKYKQ